LISALSDTADRGADLVDGAVDFSKTGRTWRGGLRVAFVPATDEAAAVAERTIGNANVARVVVAAGDSSESDEENPEAFHRRFDARHTGLFTSADSLKSEQFR
jgi:hypothetical protein